MKVSCAAFAREKKEKSQTQKALSIERERVSTISSAEQNEFILRAN